MLSVAAEQEQAEGGRGDEHGERFLPEADDEGEGQDRGQENADREELIEQETQEAKPWPRRTPDSDPGEGIDDQPTIVEDLIAGIVRIELLRDLPKVSGPIL